MKKGSRKEQRNSNSIPKKKIKRTIVTKEIKIITYDPNKKEDVDWITDRNYSLTRNGFEMIDFVAGLITYKQEYYEEY